jgi:hypothetical protein
VSTLASLHIFLPSFNVPLPYKHLPSFSTVSSLNIFLHSFNFLLP